VRFRSSLATAGQQSLTTICAVLDIIGATPVTFGGTACRLAKVTHARVWRAKVRSGDALTDRSFHAGFVDPRSIAPNQHDAHTS
jgi:hypothetical protein